MSAVLSFPIVGVLLPGEHLWELSEEKLAEYQEAYPDMDVLLVAKRARQWLIDNPRKRKTARGMPKFLGSWIERQQNSGRYPLRGATGAEAGAGACNRCGGTGRLYPNGRYAGAPEPCKKCQGTGRY